MKRIENFRLIKFIEQVKEPQSLKFAKILYKFENKSHLGYGVNKLYKALIKAKIPVKCIVFSREELKFGKKYSNIFEFADIIDDTDEFLWNFKNIQGLCVEACNLTDRYWLSEIEANVKELEFYNVKGSIVPDLLRQNFSQAIQDSVVKVFITYYLDNSSSEFTQKFYKNLTNTLFEIFPKLQNIYFGLFCIVDEILDWQIMELAQPKTSMRTTSEDEEGDFIQKYVNVFYVTSKKLYAIKVHRLDFNIPDIPESLCSNDHSVKMPKIKIVKLVHCIKPDASKIKQVKEFIDQNGGKENFENSFILETKNFEIRDNRFSVFDFLNLFKPKLLHLSGFYSFDNLNFTKCETLLNFIKKNRSRIAKLTLKLDLEFVYKESSSEKLIEVLSLDPTCLVLYDFYEIERIARPKVAKVVRKCLRKLNNLVEVYNVEGGIRNYNFVMQGDTNQKIKKLFKKS